MKASIALVAAGVFLSGCTAQQLLKDLNETKAVCDLNLIPELKPIAGKLPLSLEQLKDTPLSMLALDRFPSEEERQAISAFDTLNEPCRQKGEQNANKYYGGVPEVLSVAQISRSALRQNLADLFQSKITYATHNSRSQTIYNGYIDVTSRILGAYQARQQQQAAEFAKVYLNQALTQPQTPTITNCSGFQNSISCVSNK